MCAMLWNELVGHRYDPKNSRACRGTDGQLEGERCQMEVKGDKWMVSGEEWRLIEKGKIPCIAAAYFELSYHSIFWLLLMFKD